MTTPKTSSSASRNPVLAASLLAAILADLRSKSARTDEIGLRARCALPDVRDSAPEPQARSLDHLHNRKTSTPNQTQKQSTRKTESSSTDTSTAREPLGLPAVTTAAARVDTSACLNLDQTPTKPKKRTPRTLAGAPRAGQVDRESKQSPVDETRTAKTAASRTPHRRRRQR